MLIESLLQQERQREQARELARCYSRRGSRGLWAALSRRPGHLRRLQRMHALGIPPVERCVRYAAQAGHVDALWDECGLAPLPASAGAARCCRSSYRWLSLSAHTTLLHV